MQLRPSRFFRGKDSSNEESINSQTGMSNTSVYSVYNVNKTQCKGKLKRNRRKRKGTIMKQTKALSFLSCNVASVQNKLLSLEKVVNDLNLSFFALQETHAKKEGSIKFKNSQNFQIYEHIRLQKSGGGLALGILKTLNPFWIRDGGIEVEAMTIKASFRILRFELSMDMALKNMTASRKNLIL